MLISLKQINTATLFVYPYIFFLMKSILRYGLEDSCLERPTLGVGDYGFGLWSLSSKYTELALVAFWVKY